VAAPRLPERPRPNGIRLRCPARAGVSQGVAGELEYGPSGRNCVSRTINSRIKSVAVTDGKRSRRKIDVGNHITILLVGAQAHENSVAIAACQRLRLWVSHTDNVQIKVGTVERTIAGLRVERSYAKYNRSEKRKLEFPLSHCVFLLLENDGML